MEKVKWEECKAGDNVVVWLGRRDGRFEELAGKFVGKLGPFEDIVAVRRGFFKHIVIDGRTGMICGAGRTPKAAEQDALNYHRLPRVWQVTLYLAARKEYERKLDLWIQYGRPVYRGIEDWAHATTKNGIDIEFDPEVKPDGVLH